MLYLAALLGPLQGAAPEGERSLLQSLPAAGVRHGLRALGDVERVSGSLEIREQLGSSDSALATYKAESFTPEYSKPLQT
jgi:hypothetical protein